MKLCSNYILSLIKNILLKCIVFSDITVLVFSVDDLSTNLLILSPLQTNTVFRRGVVLGLQGRADGMFYSDDCNLRTLATIYFHRWFISITIFSNMLPQKLFFNECFKNVMDKYSKTSKIYTFIRAILIKYSVYNCKVVKIIQSFRR